MNLMRILTAVWSVLLLAAPTLAFQPPSGQTEFVPANELPPIEQLPAAPLLVTAYAFFLVLMVSYVWTVWRRLNRVDADIRALQQRASRSAR
jgi:hypothetical protein